MQEETKKIALEYKILEHNITEEEANQLASDAMERVKKKAGTKDKSKKKTKKPASKSKGTGTSSPLWIPPLKSGGTKYGEHVDLGGYQR